MTIYLDEIAKYFEANKFYGTPESLYAPANYLMSLGGKKIRPALVLMACHLYDEDFKKALAAAHAVEVFHNFSLMHDDIMDKASLRRGQKTVHELYDVNTAILSGDVMLIKCYEMLAAYDDNRAIALIRIFNKMAVELCEGQRMDMDFETSDQVTIEAYLKMITYKTSVLLACALQIGSIIGGGNEEDQHHLYEFGKNIGIAFQIQDDLLDAFGEESKVGKKAGGDIIQNKKTYLYLKAKSLADGRQNEVLDHYYKAGDFDENEKVAAVKNVFEVTGAREYANQLRDVYRDLAASHVLQLNINKSRKDDLLHFASFLVNRQL